MPVGDEPGLDHSAMHLRLRLLQFCAGPSDVCLAHLAGSLPGAGSRYSNAHLSRFRVFGGSFKSERPL